MLKVLKFSSTDKRIYELTSADKFKFFIPLYFNCFSFKFISDYFILNAANKLFIIYASKKQNAFYKDKSGLKLNKE